MTEPRSIDGALLKALPLPEPPDGSKEERGRISIIGGSRHVPGAVLLAGHGALRAGAGKLQIATVESRAGALALSMPEALVIDLPETPAGRLQAGPVVAELARWDRAQALLVGPGMVEEPDSHAILESLVAGTDAPVIVVDAGALPRIRDLQGALRARRGRPSSRPMREKWRTCLKSTRRRWRPIRMGWPVDSQKNSASSWC